MSSFTAKIKIMPKPGVLDPQGKAVMHSLETLGFKGIDDTRIGKYIEVKLDSRSKSEALETANAMCRQLLANQVIEAFDVDIE
jgi:phosphoribosylformylglycinamidine synthase